MARKVSRKDGRYLARLVTENQGPCAFCLREVDDEITYGKLYAIGDIQCHYYCCLLSCCLIQKGHDEEGLFGFMYPDILAEVERCKKHKCSYCGRSGANLGCSVGACRKQFHLPCGRDKSAVSLYYGSYKSFCQQHAPKQKVPEHIMVKARLRMKLDRNQGKDTTGDTNLECGEEMVCVICYEAVRGFPTVDTFWPPCCGKDAWFHRTCLQRMALSAGMHYLRCPLCNDKETFYDAVINQGYYVPDRDAAWELEQNAFAEIYERPAACVADACLCPRGRTHDEETGKWDIKLCLLCGSAGAHAQCIDQSQPSKPVSTSLDQSVATQANAFNQSVKITEITTSTDQSETNEENELCGQENGSRNVSYLSSKHSNTSNQSNASDQTNTSPDQSDTSSDQSNTSPAKSITSLRFVCRSCLPAAPEDLDALATSIEAIIQLEQAQSAVEARRPLMPSRMSIRSTKGRAAPRDSSRPAPAPSRPILKGRRLSYNSSMNVAQPGASARRQSLLDIDMNMEREPLVPPKKRPSTSRANGIDVDNSSSESLSVAASRRELNLRSPRRPHCGPAFQQRDESKLLSPIKLLEESFKEKMVCSGVRDAVLDAAVVDTLRRKFRKPRPLCEKRRIVNDILDGVFDDLLNNSKQREQVKEWCSPKKYHSVGESKELQYGLSESLRDKHDQDKENDSNTYNTPSKDPCNVEHAVCNLLNRYENLSQHNTEFHSEDDNGKNVVTINKIENINDIKDMSGINEIETQDENEEIQNITVNVSNEQCDDETEESRGKEIEKKSNAERNISENHNENCESYDTNKFNDTPIRMCNKNRIKRRKSVKLLFYTKNVSNSESNSDSCSSNEKTKGQIEETFDESSIKLKKSISEPMITENIDVNKTINKPKEEVNTETKQIKATKNIEIKKSASNKSKRSKKSRRKSQKGIEKSKHSNKNSLDDKDKQKVRSKSESSTEINILKRLLTEQDLCSQLLLELTSGKFNDSNTEMINNESQNNFKKSQKSNDDISKSLQTVKCNEIAKDSKRKSNSSRNPSIIKALKDSEINSKPSKTKLNLRYGTKSPQNKKDDSNSTLKSSNKSIQSNKTVKDSNVTQKLPKSIDLDQTQSLTESPINLNDPNNLVDTPKHKTIEIQQDSSLEISENDQHINIDVITVEDSPTTGDSYKNLKIKMPEQLKTCFKFSPIEGTLDKHDGDIDLESFKKEYLSEVDREFKCDFKHKHTNETSEERKFRTPIDFAVDATLKNEDSGRNSKKRKLSESGVKLVFDGNIVKKRKMSESDITLLYDYDKKNPERSNEDKAMENNEPRKKKDKNKRREKETKRRRAKRDKRKSSSDKNIEVTIDSSEKRSSKAKKIKKKIKTKFQIKNENIHLKIKWKKKLLSLNIESKKQDKKEKKIKDKHSKFKQYVLQFPENSSKEVLVKPEKEVSPLKRKYVRNDKTPPDKLKQMSIQSFFKLKSDVKTE